MGLEYYWRRLAKSWDFWLWGKHVSFGVWLNVVTDKASEETSAHSRSINGEKEYQYRSLEHPKDIRVLELAPGEPHDPLKGRLIHTPSIPNEENTRVLDWSLKYEALSYAWGDEGLEKRTRMLVDDDSYLMIWPNLDIALRHLRSPKVSRTLWVDAICINQMDNSEKMTQVEMMLDVYAGAELVNIWLGPAHGASSSGMNILRYLAESTLDKPAPWTQTPDDDLVSGLREILRRDWFSRIWVVQEAAVSQRAVMMCGEESFSWWDDPVQVRKFIRRVKYACVSPQWEQAGLSEFNLGSFLQVLNLQLQHIKRQRNNDVTPPPDILDIAFELRHRKSSDRRDKLFAIMGLVDQRNRSTFRANYSMNVEEVFQELLESVEI